MSEHPHLRESNASSQPSESYGTGAFVAAGIAAASAALAMVLVAVSLGSDDPGMQLVFWAVFIPALILITVVVGMVAIVLAFSARSKHPDHSSKANWAFVLSIIAVSVMVILGVLVYTPVSNLL